MDMSIFNINTNSNKSEIHALPKKEQSCNEVPIKSIKQVRNFSKKYLFFQSLLSLKQENSKSNTKQKRLISNQETSKTSGFSPNTLYLKSSALGFPNLSRKAGLSKRPLSVKKGQSLTKNTYQMFDSRIDNAKFLIESKPHKINPFNKLEFRYFFPLGESTKGNKALFFYWLLPFVGFVSSLSVNSSNTSRSVLNGRFPPTAQSITGARRQNDQNDKDFSYPLMTGYVWNGTTHKSVGLSPKRESLSETKLNFHSRFSYAPSNSDVNLNGFKIKNEALTTNSASIIKAQTNLSSLFLSQIQEKSPTSSALQSKNFVGFSGNNFKDLITPYSESLLAHAKHHNENQYLKWYWYNSFIKSPKANLEIESKKSNTDQLPNLILSNSPVIPNMAKDHDLFTTASNSIKILPLLDIGPLCEAQSTLLWDNSVGFHYIQSNPTTANNVQSMNLDSHPKFKTEKPINFSPHSVKLWNQQNPLQKTTNDFCATHNLKPVKAKGFTCAKHKRLNPIAFVSLQETTTKCLAQFGSQSTFNSTRVPKKNILNYLVAVKKPKKSFNDLLFDGSNRDSRDLERDVANGAIAKQAKQSAFFCYRALLCRQKNDNNKSCTYPTLSYESVRMILDNCLKSLSKSNKNQLKSFYLPKEMIVLTQNNFINVGAPKKNLQSDTTDSSLFLAEAEISKEKLKTQRAFFWIDSLSTQRSEIGDLDYTLAKFGGFDSLLLATNKQSALTKGQDGVPHRIPDFQHGLTGGVHELQQLSFFHFGSAKKQKQQKTMLDFTISKVKHPWLNTNTLPKNREFNNLSSKYEHFSEQKTSLEPSLFNRVASTSNLLIAPKISGRSQTASKPQVYVSTQNKVDIFKTTNLSKYLNFVVRKTYLNMQNVWSNLGLDGFNHKKEALKETMYARSPRSIEKIIRAKLSLKNNSKVSQSNSKLKLKASKISFKLRSLYKQSNSKLLDSVIPFATMPTDSSVVFGENSNKVKDRRLSAIHTFKNLSPSQFLKNKKLVASFYTKDLNPKLTNLSKVNKKDFFYSQNLIQKKIKQQKQHRLKKYELDSRRTLNKKRSRGYPRPEWLRFKLYQKFVKTRWNTLFLVSKNKERSSVGRLSKTCFANRKAEKTKKFLTFNSGIGIANKGSFYNVSKNTLRYLKMAESESYWFRSNVKPYLRRIQKYLNDARMTESQWQFVSTIQTFVPSLLGFSQTEHSPLNQGSACGVPAKQAKQSALFSFFATQKNRSVTSFQTVGQRPTKHPIEGTTSWQKALAISEYNRILYERTQTILAGLKENVNGDTHTRTSPGSLSLGRLKIKALKEKILEDMFLSSKTAKSNIQKTEQWQSGLKRWFEQSLNLKRSSYWFNPGSQLRPYWAFNKTNAKYSQQMSKVHRLWTNQKLKEQAFANKTKFLQKKILTRWDALFSGDLYLAKFIADSSRQSSQMSKTQSFQNKWDFRISQKARQKEEKVSLLSSFSTHNTFNSNNQRGVLLRSKVRNTTVGIPKSYNNAQIGWWSNLNSISVNSLNPKLSLMPLFNASFERHSNTENESFSQTLSGTLMLYGCTVLFHFCALISLISIPQVRCFIKFHLILIFKLAPMSVQIVHEILAFFKKYSNKVLQAGSILTGGLRPLLSLKTDKSFNHKKIDLTKSKKAKTKLKTTLLNRSSNKSQLWTKSQGGELINEVVKRNQKSAISLEQKVIKTSKKFVLASKSYSLNSIGTDFNNHNLKIQSKLSLISTKSAFIQPLLFGAKRVILSFTQIKSLFRLSRFISAFLWSKLVSSKSIKSLVFEKKHDGVPQAPDGSLVTNMTESYKSINSKIIDFVIACAARINLLRLNLFKSKRKGPTNLLGQTREFVLITEFLADVLILSWSSDFILLIPEKVELDTWNYFLKMSRVSQSPVRLSLFFDILVETLSQPDTDLIARQQKGTIFWDIWGDFLIKAAESYKMHIPSISQYKEEQTLLVERFLEESNSFNSKSVFQNSLLMSFDQTSVRSAYTPQSSLLNHLVKFAPSSNTKSKALQTNEVKEKTNSWLSFCFSKNINQQKKPSASRLKRWFVDQYLTSQSKETNLLIDLHPPKSFAHIGAFKYYSKSHQCIGTLVCQIYSGIFAKKASKNVLVVGKPSVASLLIQALAGETEFKIMTDNALPYATVTGGFAVGIKLLKDVFDSIAVHAPCIFLLEDIHHIGERRPLSMSDDENTGAFDELVSSFGILNSPLQVHEKNQVFYEVFRHSINHYKKPFRGDFSLLIPTNHFSVDLFLGVSSPRSRQGAQWNNTLPSSLSISTNERTQVNTTKDGSTHKFNRLGSSLQLPSDQLFAPPSTSPLSVLVLKEQKKLKPKKIVNDLPFTGMTSHSSMLNAKINYSIRLKVAMLSELAMSKLSGKFEMVTDLLMILDSVRSQRGFIVFATTNSPSILDPALRRPGRLDETIYLPTIPNLWSRWEILKSSLSSLSHPNLGSFFGFPRGFTFDYLSNAKLQQFTHFKRQKVSSTVENGAYAKQSAFFATQKNAKNDNNKGVGNCATQKNPLAIAIAMGGLTSVSRTTTKVHAKRIKSTQNSWSAIPNKTNIKAISYFNISQKLISTQYSYNGTNYNGIIWDASTSSMEEENKQEENKQEEKYISMYSPKIMLKKQLLRLFAGKIGETLAFSTDSISNSSASSKITSSNEVQTKLCAKRINLSGHQRSYSYQNLSTYGIDQTWRSATSLVFALIQKRYLYSQNKILFKLLSFVDGSNSASPSGQRSEDRLFAIFAPAKRYENYKRTERDFRTKQSYKLLDKIQMHQQQRFTRRLYRLPVKEFFRSEIIENGLTTFANVSRVLGPLDLSSSLNQGFKGSAHKTTAVNWYYRKRILNRHRHYLTNQWWNGQFPEHNAETVFLSDVDWRYNFVESLGDLLIDFPDSDQYYNPKRRRWTATSGSWSYGLDFAHKQILDQEIYTHYMLESYFKAYSCLDQNREILDYLGFKFMKLGYLQEIQLLNTKSKFQFRT